MQTDSDNGDGGISVIKVVVIAGVVVLLLLAGYIFFIESFAFGARPGLPPSGSIMDLPLVGALDHAALHVPVIGSWGERFLRWQTIPNLGPQKVWRWYATWLAVIMIGSGILMLLAKRFVETTNDETTVMHLKGDTTTAFRAKGFRG